MHTIGAFAVILDDELRVLMCHRTDCDMWNLPGGRVEVGESPWQAVIREVQEETGFDVEVRRLLGVYAIPERSDVVFCFACVRTGGSPRVNDEADDIRWFPRGDLPKNTLPRHVERIADAFAGAVCTKLKTQ